MSGQIGTPRRALHRRRDGEISRPHGGDGAKTDTEGKIWAQMEAGAWFIPKTEAERYARDVKGKPGRQRRHVIETGTTGFVPDEKKE